MRNTDLFGEPLKLNYNGDYLFKTPISGIVSVLLLIATGSYFILNIYNMTQHTGLIMNNYQTSMFEDDPLYKFNQSNYFLAVRLFTSSGKNILSNKSLSNYFKFSSFYYEKYKNGSFNKTYLDTSQCNITINPLLPNLSGLYCLDFNNSELGGNYYSISQYFYVQVNIYFNYSQFYNDFNTSLNIFPVRAAIYNPIAYIDPLDYSDPFSNGTVIQNFRCNYNISKNVEMSAQLIELNTDSSYISKSNSTQNVFTSNYKLFSEDFSNDNDDILKLTYFLDPIKNVYNRRYMKLTDVLNTVTSLANILFIIFGLICRSYNEYKLKVDFIEENILYRMGELEKKDLIILNNKMPILENGVPENENPRKISENIGLYRMVELEKKDSNIIEIDKSILINKLENEPPEKEKPIITAEENQKDNKISLPKSKFNKKPKKIIMKSFFNSLFCSKPVKNKELYTVSDAADNFYKDFVDVKKFILLLAQFEELKETWLHKYQNVLLNRSKIILKPDKMMKNNNDESKFEKSFKKLNRNIDEEKYDKVDLMLLSKF